MGTKRVQNRVLGTNFWRKKHLFYVLNNISITIFVPPFFWRSLKEPCTVEVVFVVFGNQVAKSLRWSSIFVNIPLIVAMFIRQNNSCWQRAHTHAGFNKLCVITNCYPHKTSSIKRIFNTHKRPKHAHFLDCSILWKLKHTHTRARANDNNSDHKPSCAATNTCRRCSSSPSQYRVGRWRSSCTCNSGNTSRLQQAPSSPSCPACPSGRRRSSPWPPGHKRQTRGGMLKMIDILSWKTANKSGGINSNELTDCFSFTFCNFSCSSLRNCSHHI